MNLYSLKRFIRTYYVPGTVLSAGGKKKKKKTNIYVLREIRIHIYEHIQLYLIFLMLTSISLNE